MTKNFNGKHNFLLYCFNQLLTNILADFVNNLDLDLFTRMISLVTNKLRHTFFSDVININVNFEIIHVISK